MPERYPGEWSDHHCDGPPLGALTWDVHRPGEPGVTQAELELECGPPCVGCSRRKKAAGECLSFRVEGSAYAGMYDRSEELVEGRYTWLGRGMDTRLRWYSGLLGRDPVGL